MSFHISFKVSNPMVLFWYVVVWPTWRDKIWSNDPRWPISLRSLHPSWDLTGPFCSGEKSWWNWFPSFWEARHGHPRRFQHHQFPPCFILCLLFPTFSCVFFVPFPYVRTPRPKKWSSWKLEIPLRKLHHDPRVLEILYRIESWLSYAGTPGAAEMVGPEIVHARLEMEISGEC